RRRAAEDRERSRSRRRAPEGEELLQRPFRAPARDAAGVDHVRHAPRGAREQYARSHGDPGGARQGHGGGRAARRARPDRQPRLQPGRHWALRRSGAVRAAARVTRALLVMAATVLLAGCGSGTKAARFNYPEAVTKNYMQSCLASKKTTRAYCSCTL